MKLFGLGSKDIGIDLGTANILVIVKGKGVVLNEPSVVAIDRKTGDILATGYEAKEMLGRTPEEIKAVRPLKDGVIADFTATQLMLKNMLKKIATRYNAGRIRVVVGVPSGITEVEERAVEESIEQAGAREVYLMEEPMAAAIGETTAEQIKLSIGCAMPLMTETSMEVRGRSLSTGLPVNITLTSTQIEEAMRGSINEIVDVIKATLEKTPPELAADIVEKGIYLAGGGALIKNLDKLISNRTGIPVFVAQNPLECVVNGTAKTLEDLEKLKDVLINARKRR